MIPVIRMQDIVNQFPDRTGHRLLGEEQGCVNVAIAEYPISAEKSMEG